MQRNIIRVLCYIYIILSLFAEAVILNREGFSWVMPYKTIGKVVIHHSELVPRSKISQFLIRDGKIFILYDDVGLVNVYTVAGAFQYGIQVNTLSNDRGGIAFYGSKLLVKAKGNVIYIFNDMALDHYVVFSHSQRQQMTDEAIEYERLDAYFGSSEPQEYLTTKYLLSSANTELLVTNAKGEYVPVDFLPQRNMWVSILPIGMLICLVLLIRAYKMP